MVAPKEGLWYDMSASSENIAQFETNKSGMCNAPHFEEVKMHKCFVLDQFVRRTINSCVSQLRQATHTWLLMIDGPVWILLAERQNLSILLLAVPKTSTAAR